MRSGASRFPLLLTAAAVLVLLGIVALASSGSTPTGSDDARPPSDIVVDTIFSLGLVLLIPAFAVFIYGLMQRKAIQREIATKKYRRIAYPLFIALVFLYTAGLWFLLHVYHPQQPAVPGEQGTPGAAPPGVLTGADADTRDPEFAWIPVSIVLALTAIAVGAFVLAGRRRRSHPVVVYRRRARLARV